MAGNRGFKLVGIFLVALAMGCAAARPPLEPTPAAPTTAQAGATTVVAVAPPAQPCCKMTLWEFLGVKRAFEVVGGLFNRLRNRLGARFPGLEAKPEVLSITDPANMQSDNPAVKSAAETKAEEDAAQQKIKALRYLADIGCAGCYPGIEDALLAALDDCTEEVRYEAVKALRSTTGNPCKRCKKQACCSPKVMARLRKLANDIESSGCYVEPSARVRRIARLAMQGCGDLPAAAPEQAPTEGPPAPPPQQGTALNSASGLTINGRVEVATNTTASSAGEAAMVSHAAPLAAPALSGQVVAKVDGQAIYESQVLPQVEEQLNMVRDALSPELRGELRRTLMEREVNRAVLLAVEQRQAVASAVRPAGCCDPPPAHDALDAGRVSEHVTPGEIVRYYQAHAPRFAGMPRAEAEQRIRQELIQSRRTAREHERVSALRQAGRVWTVFDQQGAAHVSNR